MIHKTLHLILLICWLSFFRLSFAQSADDITLIGNNHAIYSLEYPLSKTVVTSQQENVILEINDVVVESRRILVRFFIWDLPLTWEEKINASSRLNGDYLPVAEVGTPKGKWLTPSSASKYCLIASGDSLVVGGLMEFFTDEAPKIISLNFNQIPFDERPLAEGAVIQVKLAEGEQQERNTLATLSDTVGSVEFSLHSTAQTSSISMIQPAVRMLRADESLSQFGWINVNREDGKTYALQRGSLYGFNLADDSTYTAAHAYTFLPIDSSEPLTITMDYAYVKRTVSDNVILSLTGDSGQLDIPLQWEDFHARIQRYAIFSESAESHDYSALRLFLDVDEQISNIDFYLADSDYSDQQAVCGFIPQSDQFACDVVMHGDSYEELLLGIRSIEYRVDGPWNIQWKPMQMVTQLPAEKYDVIRLESNTKLIDIFPEAAEDLKPKLVQLQTLSETLSGKSGWVLQKTEIESAIAGEDYPELVSHAQKKLQMTHVIQENWDQIREDGSVGENLTIMRDLQDDKILSGTWTNNGKQVILPHALLYTSSRSFDQYAVPYIYGSELLSLLDTGSSYLGKEECFFERKKAECFRFQQSLLADSESSPVHEMTFWIDETGKIIHSEVKCDLDGNGMKTCVTQTLRELVYKKDLPKDLKQLMENILY